MNLLTKNQAKAFKLLNPLLSIIYPRKFTVASGSLGK